MIRLLKKIILVALVLFILFSVGALWLSYSHPPAPMPISGDIVKSDITATTKAVYRPDDVARHRMKNDCWLIVRGNVYDVTSYISRHPGGRSTILNRCGREVTSVFASIHSNRAWDLLGKYRIGSIGTPSTDLSKKKEISVQAIAKKVKGDFPDADVLRVQAFGDGFLALIATPKALYDVILDKKGEVISQQARSDEFEWFWNADDNEAEEAITSSRGN